MVANFFDLLKFENGKNVLKHDSISWSEWAGQEKDPSYGFQISPIVNCGEASGISLFKFATQGNLTMHFPGGATVLTINGELVVADHTVAKPEKSNSELPSFTEPFTLLENGEMMVIAMNSPAKFVANQVETIFILFHPGGFELY